MAKVYKVTVCGETHIYDSEEKVKNFVESRNKLVVEAGTLQPRLKSIRNLQARMFWSSGYHNGTDKDLIAEFNLLELEAKSIESRLEEIHYGTIVREEWEVE